MRGSRVRVKSLDCRDVSDCQSLFTVVCRTLACDGETGQHGGRSATERAEARHKKGCLEFETALLGCLIVDCMIVGGQGA